MAEIQQDDRSVSELVKALSEQTTALARKEVELAKVELAQKGKKAGIGAGMFGGAGVLGFYAFGALTAGLILLLGTTAIVSWLAALIVAAVYGAIAGILALSGKKKVEEATPAAPERAIENVKEDVQSTKQRAQEARQ